MEKEIRRDWGIASSGGGDDAAGRLWLVWGCSTGTDRQAFVASSSHALMGTPPSRWHGL